SKAPTGEWAEPQSSFQDAVRPDAPAARPAPDQYSFPAARPEKETLIFPPVIKRPVAKDPDREGEGQIEAPGQERPAHEPTDPAPAHEEDLELAGKASS